jgi:4-hydroxy-3-methylbut-2-enyl diphosphate reductase
LRAEWFRDGDRVGVCGATSTPKWLLEDVAQKILQEK